MAGAVGVTFPACVDAAFGQSKRTIPNTFNCQIKQYFEANDSDLLEDQLLAPRTDAVRDQDSTFLSNAISGKMLTKSFPFIIASNSDMAATVLDQGSEEQSTKFFTAIT